MRKNIMLLISVFSIFLFLMIPHTPALQYTMVQNEYENGLLQVIPVDQQSLSPTHKISLSKSDINNEVIETIQGLILLLMSGNENTKGNTPLLRSLLSILVNIIIFILNVLITIISILSGIITTIFSIIVSIIISIIKKIFNFGELMQKLLDVLASIVTGFFSIILNVVVGVLSIIKNVLVDLIKPPQNSMTSYL